MKKYCYSITGFGVIFLAAQLVFGQAHFTAKFSTAQESDDVTSDATGTASCFLTEEGLWFYITADSLSSDMTAAHFHIGAIGVDGPPVRTITDDFNGNTATGLWSAPDPEPLTPEMVQALFAGNLYLNIHTMNNPAGEIRAQVVHSAGTGLSANMTPEAESHDVTSDASGTASIVVTDAGVAFKITVDGLTGPMTNAHFHGGAAGVDGPPVRTILNDFEGTTAFGFWTANDSEPLTDELLADLLLGNLYLNVHTAAYGAGELRGQVYLNSGIGLHASPDAEQEDNNVDSDATGTAALTLTPAGLVFNVSVDSLTGPTTNAHFHHAPAGTNGPPVRTILGDFSGNTASGVWRVTDDEPLTPEMIQEILSGNIYINVHTAAYSGGEIRGQVELNAGTSLAANLTSAQQNPSVDAPAKGTASLWLTDEGVNFNVTVEGLSGPITVAHFHTGATGVNGPPVRTITDDFIGPTASGVWTSSDSEALTPELIQDLLAGNLYLNVHTAANQPGETRGQIVLSGGSDLTATLTPEQEPGDISSSGSGTAAMILTPAGVQFRVTVDSLTGPITVAHFHGGSTGVNGSPVRTITGDFDGNTATGLWTANDAEPLTPGMAQALLTGNLYLNVHTGSNPGGELRGQVFVNSGWGITTRLDAAQETHDVTSDAMGTSALTLTDAGVIFDLTAEGLSGEITVAHFHSGEVGVSGSPVRTITDDFDGNTASGVWRSSDAEPLTVEMINAIIGGGLYLNVHTAANQQGEIRGQVNPAEVITSVKLVEDAGVPSAFDLEQNYPNPFNPETSITYSLANTGRVQVTIYNLLGQQVRNLVDATQQAGRYRALWDGRNNRGEIVPSGVYIYRMETGDFSAVRKMTFLQ